MTDDTGSDPTDSDDRANTDGATDDSKAAEPERDLQGNWTDRIVGERMEVDREFSEKVAASNFSNQQWGLIMTAVEFDVENADDPERARLVADTSKIESVLPQLERMGRGGGMGGMPGGGGGRGRESHGGGDRSGSGDSGGLFDGVKKALGLGKTETDREQLAAAEEMAQMYADDLQEKLEARGKWELIATAARE